MFRRHGWMACLVALMITGCASQEQRVSDLSAPPAPRLEWARVAPTRQVASAVPAKDLVIREHRFVSHSAELNSDGEDQIQRVANALKATPARIVIESSGGTPVLPATLTGSVDTSAKLDLQRRQYVIQKLLSLGIPDAEKRVVLEPTHS